MVIRPRTVFVKKLKARRCTSCGGKLHKSRTRCKRCATQQARPTK